ncbi:MAG TPA: hypothetical protein VI612_00300 [Candidatus Nanoarchaeia archaeon]|nr:hypothetical protein [Candidatus Nanoarchaeia archaeon]
MGVVHVFYRTSSGGQAATRAIEHDGKFYEIRLETHYLDDKAVALYPIPQEKIERTAPVHDRLSQLEIALVKALSEGAGKVTVPMPIQIRSSHPNI